MARTCHRSRATGRRGGLGPGRMVWAARAASHYHNNKLDTNTALPYHGMHVLDTVVISRSPGQRVTVLALDALRPVGIGETTCLRYVSKSEPLHVGSCIISYLDYAISLEWKSLIQIGR